MTGTIPGTARTPRRVLDGASDKRSVLVVLHQETSSTGRIGQILAAAGVPIDIRRPVIGEALPATLADHRGAIVFGGPPSANDAEPHLRAEIDWLDVPLRENRPFLGICLGAQMLAKHLGGRVAPHRDGLVEIGYYDLTPTAAGRAFMANWPATVYQWHREGFDLPRGTVLLAEGERFPNQAYRYGEKAFGVQFHAELTLAMLHRWTTRGHERLSLPGAQVRRAHFEGRAAFDAPIRRWLEEFLVLVFGENEAAAD